MKELLNERRKTKVEEWRDTVVAAGGVTQMTAAGSRSSEADGDLLSEVGALYKDTKEDYVSALSLTSPMELKIQAEDEKNVEELSFCPKCSQRATLGPALV